MFPVLPAVGERNDRTISRRACPESQTVTQGESSDSSYSSAIAYAGTLPSPQELQASPKPSKSSDQWHSKDLHDQYQTDTQDADAVYCKRCVGVRADYTCTRYFIVQSICFPTPQLRYIFGVIGRDDDMPLAPIRLRHPLIVLDELVLVLGQTYNSFSTIHRCLMPFASPEPGCSNSL